MNMATATPTKTNKVEKSDWTEPKNGLSTRTVKTRTRGGVDIQYNESKLDDSVKTVEDAVKLLGLKARSAVSALVIGSNKLARRKVAGNASLVAAIAEHKGISIEEARKLLG
jgi:hypothetical protein